MKKIIMFLLSVIMGSFVFAHSPVLSIDEIGDGKIYIEGGFSDGQTAEGIKCIIVKDKAYNGPEDTFKGKEIIYIGTFGKDNSITIPKPMTPKYEVYFDGGEGHILGKKGPKLKKEEESKWNEVVSTFDYGQWKEAMLSK